MDLSSSEGHSINDGVNPEKCSKAYIYNNIAEYVLALSRNALLTKSLLKEWREVGLLADSSASRWSCDNRDGLERAVFCGHDSPVQSMLGPLNLLGCGRRSGVVNVASQGAVHFQFDQWFHYHQSCSVTRAWVRLTDAKAGSPKPRPATGRRLDKRPLDASHDPQHRSGYIWLWWRLVFPRRSWKSSVPFSLTSMGVSLAWREDWNPWSASSSMRVK